jgi:hypothetical protein
MTLLETLKPPPTLPPGVTLESRANKFSGWSGANGYYGSGSRRLDVFKSDAKNSQDSTTDFQLFAQTYNMSKSLKNEQRGVTEAKVQREYSASLMRSTFQCEYGHIRAEMGEFDMNKFREAFDGYCEQGFGVINARNVERMVVEALGEYQPQYIYDKYIVLIRDEAINRKVTWESIESLVPKVAAIIAEECKPKREKPYMMGGKIAIDKGLGTGDPLSTNYRDNFKDGHRYPDVPGWKRIDGYMEKPLYYGTSKATAHIPGYSGHMPLNTLNPHKLKHSRGIAKAIQNDLMLTRKGTLFSMGNYSGHIPQYSVMKNERMTGCDPLSTMGASFAGTRYLV